MEFNQFSQNNQFPMNPSYMPYRQFGFANMNSSNPMMGFNQDTWAEQDMQHLKEMFPEGMKQIQMLVEEELDRMEYDGSPIFDEYPDQITLTSMRTRIVKRVEINGISAESIQMAEDENLYNNTDNQGDIQAFQWGCRDGFCSNNVLDDVVSVLLFNELHRRRRRHRGRRRFW